MSDTESKDKVTIQEAARALNVDPRTIYRWIGKGVLSKTKANGKTYVLLTDVKVLSDKSQISQTLNVVDVGQPEIVIDNVSDTAKIENTHYMVDKEHYEGLLIRLGQLEAKQQLLLEYKGGLEAKDQELAEVKVALTTNTEELEKAKATLAKAKSELQKLVEYKQDSEQKAKSLLEQQAKIEQLEAEVERLRRPWWKRIFLK